VGLPEMRQILGLRAGFGTLLGWENFKKHSDLFMTIPFESLLPVQHRVECLAYIAATPRPWD